MASPTRDLHAVLREERAVRAGCRCGRVAIFNTREPLGHFSHKGWADVWPGLAQKLRCTGCGARNPRVGWQTDRAPSPTLPPRPREARASPASVPMGVDPVAWMRAWDDRERKRLIRAARG